MRYTLPALGAIVAVALRVFAPSDFFQPHDLAVYCAGILCLLVAEVLEVEVARRA